MRFGVFLAPFHPPERNPTAALEDDLSLLEELDRLGFDEAWIGEHHSGGWEIITSPEVFIAAAAARTRRIRLGTGVSSLPYHHPLLLADRMVLLSHLTKGRAMLGVGPGALPGDAHMLGIEIGNLRPMMAEALEAVLALLAAEGPVTREAGWFTLRDARLQLLPFGGSLEVAVSTIASPSGPAAAGTHGCGLLSIGATQVAGFDALASAWSVWTEAAAAAGRPEPDRSSWRLVGPIHVAETEAEARAQVAHGLPGWVRYFTQVAALPLPMPEADTVDGLVDFVNGSGFGVVGTPEMAVQQMRRLEEQSGGFGCFLIGFSTEWARPEDVRRSVQLFAAEVLPALQGSARPRLETEAWSAAERPGFIEQTVAGHFKAVEDHARSRERSGDGT
jgi:limonene 1,2-monooxygenase